MGITRLAQNNSSISDNIPLIWDVLQYLQSLFKTSLLRSHNIFFMTQSTHKVDVVPKLNHASHYNPVTFATKNIWRKQRHVTASGDLSVKAGLHLCHILFCCCLTHVSAANFLNIAVTNSFYSDTKYVVAYNETLHEQWTFVFAWNAKSSERSQ